MKVLIKIMVLLLLVVTSLSAKNDKNWIIEDFSKQQGLDNPYKYRIDILNDSITSIIYTKGKIHCFEYDTLIFILEHNEFKG